MTIVEGETATWWTIRETKPDVVVLATGATPIIPKIPGVKREIVTTPWRVLFGRKKTGRRVAVVGGGRVGCETAEFLAQRGRDTTILEAKEDIADDKGMESRKLLIRRLKESGVEVLTHSTVTEVREETVILWPGGVEERLHGIDTVVLAVGSKPADELLDPLRQSGIEVHAVGDCVEPRNMFEAIHEGFSVACRI